MQPNFIKADQSLVKDIHKEKVKEYILETFVTFAQKMNIQNIAEGIEEKDELIKLMRMGIHFGQGFLLGRPVPRLSNLSLNVEYEIKRMENMDSENFQHLI